MKTPLSLPPIVMVTSWVSGFRASSWTGGRPGAAAVKKSLVSAAPQVTSVRAAPASLRDDVRVVARRTQAEAGRWGLRAGLPRLRCRSRRGRRTAEGSGFEACEAGETVARRRSRVAASTSAASFRCIRLPRIVRPTPPNEPVHTTSREGALTGARLWGVRPVGAFRRQAQGCAELGSAMYAELLGRLADDIEAGGLTAESLQGHADDPGRRPWHCGCSGACTGWCSRGGLVLSARTTRAWGAPGSRTRAPPRSWPCSSSEPDASASGSTGRPRPTRWVAPRALVGGLLHLPVEHRGPLRLFEIGSSGGLNLLADRFEYVDESGQRFGPKSLVGPAGACLVGRTAVPGPGLRFAHSAGCDSTPSTSPRRQEGSR